MAKQRVERRPKPAASREKRGRGRDIEAVRRELAEAREQQAATAEILKVISRSPSDVQPVLEAVITSAVQLTGADNGSLYRQHGGDWHQSAIAGSFRDEPAFRARASRRVRADRSSLTGRVLLERQTVQIPDVLADVEYDLTAAAQTEGSRTMLGVPLLRGGEPIGVIVLRRRTVVPFTPQQVRLIETFADQAVIAIENVRLFNETKEALEQQTAISEILRVITASPTDVAPVLTAIAESAARFCGAEDVTVILVRDGKLYTAGHHGVLAVLADAREYRVDRGSVAGRAIVERRTIHVSDLLAEPDEEYPIGKKVAQELSYRATLATPLLREGEAIGVILLRRRLAEAFTERQVELVETFAAQAAIAIENVRLFNETKEALEQQTATAEVLKAISHSALDLKAVLDTVIESAARLCDAQYGNIRRLKGDLLHHVAVFGAGPELEDRLREPIKPARGSLTGRVALEGRPVHILDVLEDPEYERAAQQRIGRFRTMLGVPLLREGEVIGVIALWRDHVRAFTQRQIELVETFADQAVIAIENVRLFNEIQEKSAQLEVASRHKSEFLANMSHELRTPLNAIIGFSEVMLEGMFGEVNEKQREYLQDILSSGRLLLSLINDILDLSKIEAGRMELQVGTFSLRDALTNGVTMVRERATRHGIEVLVDIAPEIAEMEGDERKVKQVVYNLLSNAVKFTPDGGRVELRARVGDSTAEVSVADTGIGVPPEEQERIFEEFHQASSARSREGTGLGLTLAKRFVELHGGTIRVESSVGVGSTFTFALPLKAGVKVAM